MDKKPTFIIIIPARYASSRFPGKPLARLGDKEMILHVVDRARQTGAEVAVATDDKRIFDVVEAYGETAVMTSKNHRSGTDRIAEAYRKLNSKADVIINVQGDEPFIRPEQITQLMDIFRADPSARLATLARHFDKSKGFEALFDPNLVKLTFSDKMEALYFSRSIIPYVRNEKYTEWLDSADFYSHVGIYAYSASALAEVTALPQSRLEKAESLEQLRWLENGYRIKVAVTPWPTVGIDTPEDLAEAERVLAQGKID